MEETQSSGSEVPEQCNNFTATSREPSNLATSSNILSCKSSAKTDPIIVIDQNAVSESDSDSESDNNVDEAEIRIDKQKTNSGNEDQFIASTNSSFSDSSIISSVEPNGSNNLAKTNNPIAEGTVRNLIPADSSLCNLLVYGSSSDEEEDDVDSENEQSSDSYSCDSDNAQNDEVEIVQSSTSQIPKPTKVRKICASVGKTIKSMGELSLNDLPPVPDLSTIQIDDVSIDDCDEMGKIASVVDTLVMVESFPNKPAYDVNTLLFLNGGRQPLGYIFDVIGPVAAPMYAIRFNSSAEIDLLNISRGVKVFSAPKNTKHTQYVFVQQLLASKGTDASWKEDNELPGQDSSDIDGVEVPSDFEPDFSDDEQELEAARQRRFQNQRGGSKAAAALMAGSRRLKHKRNSLERHRTFEKDMNVRNLMDTNIHRLRESYYEATAAPPMQKRHAPNYQYRQHMHQPPIAPPPPPPPRHGFPPIPATFGPMPPPFPPPPCSYPHPQMGPAPPPFAAVVNHPPPFMGMGPPPPLPPPTFQVPPAAFLSRLGPPSVGPPRSMNPFAVVGPQLPHRFGMAGGGNAVGQWKPCGDPIGPGGPYHHAMVDMKMRPPHQLAAAAAAAAAAVNSAPRFMYMTGVQQQQPPPPPPGTAAGFLFYDPRAAPMRPWQPLQRPPPHQYHQHQYHQHNQKAAPGPGGPTAAAATTSHFYHKRS